MPVKTRAVIPSTRHHKRRGSALVEFAIVGLVMYLLLAATLTFGHLLFCAQTVQQVADVAAREIAHTPLAQAAAGSTATLYTLNNVLYGDAVADPNLASVRTRIFDERYLVLTIDAVSAYPPNVTYNGGHLIGDFPLVTQLLLPVMIYDQISSVGQTNAQPIQLLRYPGAIFQDSSGFQPMPGMPAPSGYLVRIPVISTPPASAAGTGNSSLYPTVQETITGWVRPLEPILNSAGQDAFPVTSPQMGLVALRVNYPYQSATMSGYAPAADPLAPPGPGAPTNNPVIPIAANDSIGAPAPPGVGSNVPTESPVYSGQYGLGSQAAWAQNVRPYRKLMSLQAIYRREVFQ
jgi:hypothetical protein